MEKQPESWEGEVVGVDSADAAGQLACWGRDDTRLGVPARGRLLGQVRCRGRICGSEERSVWSSRELEQNEVAEFTRAGPCQAPCQRLLHSLLTGRGQPRSPRERQGVEGVGREAQAVPDPSSLLPQALCTKVPELIRTIMGWTLDFLRERLLGWIQEQGGWVRLPPRPLTC